MKNLKEYLTNWTDLDVAAYYLGVTLGVFKGVDLDNTNQFEEFQSNKHIFWSNDPLGTLLYQNINMFVNCDILEISEDGCSVRWKGVDSLCGIVHTIIFDRKDKI